MSMEYFKNILTPRIEYLVMWRNILPCVHGLLIFVDESGDEKL
jgi:hypothetical protein